MCRLFNLYSCFVRVLSFSSFSFLFCKFRDLTGPCNYGEEWVREKHIL